MKLNINRKDNAEPITLDIDSSESVSNLIRSFYDTRDKLLNDVPFEEYQKTIELHVDNLYSDPFSTKLEPGTNLADYNLNESSVITLEHDTLEYFQSFLIRGTTQSETLNSPTFFGVTTKSGSDAPAEPTDFYELFGDSRFNCQL